MKDEAWLKFIRSLPCACCLAPPPNQAHHSTAHRRGMGLKASDHHTMPLCSVCHSDFHDSRGRFKTWSKEHKKLWQRSMVSLYRPQETDGLPSPETF